MWLLICLLMAGGLAVWGQESQWIRVESENFTVYSSAGERRARSYLDDFERVRAFFLQALPTIRPRTETVRIVIFGDRKEYREYQPNERTPAFYRGGTGEDLIVFGPLGQGAFPVAIHEYVHLLVNHAGLKLPLWQNEGLAEYYSTLEPRGSKVLAGKLPPGRRELLLMEKWIPLPVIFGVEPESEYYQDPKLAPRFYSQSWALVHMLTLEEEYRPGFARLVQEVAGGASEAEAFQKVYGKPVDAVEKDVERYYRGDVFHGALFDVEMKRVRAEKKMEAVGAYDAAVLLASIGDRQGREGETRTKLEALIARAPERPEAYRALGYLLWRTRDAGAAREHFQKAFELGDRSPRLLWDGGRLGGENSTAMLELLVQRDPERVEARLELASAQLRDGRGPAAVSTLAVVKKVTPNEAARLFQLTAYANWQTGQVEQAKVAAGRWLQFAKTEEERAAAERFGEQLARGASVPEGAGPGPMLETRPRLRRNGTEVVEEVAPPLPSVTGLFAYLDCKGPMPRARIDTDAGAEWLTLDEPDNVRISGRSGALELQCGALPAPLRVRVEYEAEGRRLRAIEVLP
ncbi:MAG: hypothetical protein M9913_16785 [Bryobacteraceae bacterium]|nr:hypothetical protein [Solibacteraceae bacterium]MCO5352523.1 hypothetical protein [Bryobacteraceae bacterium]